MIKQRSFSILLEQCLQRLDHGESLPDLLADFPDQADQLKPLLLVAMASRAFPIPVPSQTAQRLGRNQMLAEMNRLSAKEAFRKKAAVPVLNRLISSLARAVRAGGFTRLAYSYRLASVALVLILTGGFFTLSASASSQPGDPLYALKVSMQQAGLTLTYSDPTSVAGNLASPAAYTPWKFGQVVWTLEGFSGGYQTDGEGEFFAADPDELIDQEEELQEAEREAAQELKEEKLEAAEAAREAAQKLKEEEQKAAEAARETAQELKEEEQEAAEADKEEEKEAAEADKEEEKEAAEADKKEEKEAAETDKEEEQEAKEDEKDQEKEAAEEEKEAEKETAEDEKDAKRAEKEAKKEAKDSLKDDKKNK